MFALFRLRQRSEKQAKDSSRKGAESTEAKINIACNELASAVTETVKGPHDMPADPTLEMPYQGSEIMLNINGTWITSDVKRELYKAQGMGPMREYCMNKYKWTARVFDLVDSDAIMKARRPMSRMRKFQTSKMMHEWLPVNKMRGQVTGLTQCPGCTHQCEDIRHLFRCPHPLMGKARGEAIEVARKKFAKRRVPRRLVDAIAGIMRSQSGKNGEFVKPTNCPDTRRAVDQQEEIRYGMMMRGFLAKRMEAGNGGNGR